MSNLIDYLYGKTREFAGNIQVNLNALIKGKLQVDNISADSIKTAGGVESLRGIASQQGAIGGTRPAYLIGGNVSSIGLTNNTRKYGSFGAYHYTNAEEPVCVFLTDSDGTKNRLLIGGGTGGFNSVTEMSFFTGANHITTTGTERLKVDETGLATFYGKLQVDDTTEATTTTDGSLQTDGGLSVAKNAVVGGNVLLGAGKRVSNYRAASDFVTGQTLTVATIANAPVTYLLTVTSSSGVDNLSTAIYFVSTRGASSVCTAITAEIANIAVANTAGVITVVNNTGGNRVISGTMIAIGQFIGAS